MAMPPESPPGGWGELSDRARARRREWLLRELRQIVSQLHITYTDMYAVVEELCREGTLRREGEDV